MKIAGIIAEYNPLHPGHIYHIRHTRADAVVCVMDGAFTQRGEPAIFDKFARVRMALRAGCAAVIELPAVYAVAGARDFARGGVDILTQIGADEISFGCETEELPRIEAAARLLLEEPEWLKAKIKQGLAEGKSYPRATGEALGEPLMAEPNFILAVEYVRRILETGSRLTPFVLKRTDDYHSGGAGAVRRLIHGGNMEAALADLPEGLRELYITEPVSEFARTDNVILELVRRGFVTFDDTEGLFDRIKTAARSAASVAELLERVKCKRYTRARIQRELTRAVLELPPAPEKPPYLRLLGVRRDSTHILRQLTGLSSDPVRLRGNPYFEAECRATDFWGLTTDRPEYRICGRDYTQKFIIE